MTVGEIIEYTQAAIYHELCRMRMGDVAIRIYEPEYFPEDDYPDYKYYKDMMERPRGVI